MVLSESVVNGFLQLIKCQTTMFAINTFKRSDHEKEFCKMYCFLTDFYVN